MLEKLKAIKDHWLTIGEKLTDPDVMSDMKEYARLSKAYKDLKVIVDEYEIYNTVLENIAGAKEVLSTEKDEEFREMAKAELDELVPKQEQLEEKIKVLLIPKDPEDEKDAILSLIHI